MKNQTFVLIVTKQSLLGDILQELLADNDELLVHCTTPCQYQKLLREITWSDSLVVIMEKEAMDGSLSEVVREAGRHGRASLIIVSSESDDAAIYSDAYHPHYIRLTGAASLVMLVQALSTHPPGVRNWHTAVIPPSIRPTPLP